MPKYVITGAAGFIGSHVSKLLLSAGHQIVGIDNVDDYYDAGLKRWRVEQLRRSKGFSFHLADVLDKDLVARLINHSAGFDGLIHLAARAGVRPSVENPLSYINTNVVGTLNILEVCRRLEGSKLVAASSSSVYGAHNSMPYQEDAETSKPLSPYAASKKAVEELCFTYHHLYKLDISLLRFFTVYGPAGRPDMSMFRFISNIVEGREVSIFGDGTYERDFTFVDDIANGVIASLKPTGYRIYNLGADRPVQLLKVIDIIERLSGKKAKVVYYPVDPTDVPATWANVTRANQELGWRPTVSLEEGISRTLQWYLHNREWASRINQPTEELTPATEKRAAAANS